MSYLTLPAFQTSMKQLLGNYKKARFLLAVSGGVDSMVLLWLFLKSFQPSEDEECTTPLPFAVAHINYKLRGNDSEQDQKLVADFCEKNNIPLYTYEVSEQDQKPEGSIQLWARELRYRFFREIQAREKLDYLVTAHHLNDQLETFCINLSRGSGIKGLCGIPANDNNILRPLLSFPKEELYRFAKEEHIPFREDYSNKKNDYLRNKIRNEISPLLMNLNPSFLENFSKSLHLLGETHQALEQYKQSLRESIISQNANSFSIDKEQFSKLSLFLQFELLKDFGFSQENEIAKMTTSTIGSYFHSNAFTLLVDRKHLLLHSRLEISLPKWEEKIICTEIPESKIIEIEPSIFPHPTDFEWHYDASQLTFPLKIRTKQEGDYFFPMGMIGKKKVSKFFKDEKISNLAKSKIPILCDGNGNLLGVLPMRQDRRWAAHTATEQILTIKNKS